MNTLFRYLFPAFLIIAFIVLSMTSVLELNLTIIISFITILLTYFYVVSTWEMTNNMRNDSELEKRPYIIPDFHIKDHMAIVLSVKNFGKTPALNIKINVKPDIKIFNKLSLNDGFLESPISIMPPFREIKTVVGLSKDIFQDDSYPKEYEITLQYSNSRKEKFGESYILNFDFMKHEIYTERKGLHEIEKQLENLNKIIASKIDK